MLALLASLTLVAAPAPGLRAKQDPSVGTAAAPRAASVAPASAPAPIIVVGFVGGYVRRDNDVHSVVQVAARLSKSYPSGVQVMVFENHNRQDAQRAILRLLAGAGPADAPGSSHPTPDPTPEQKRDARIIIFGHSWGASETVTLARKLAADGIPVLLTIQVDSVRKHGEDDGVIPANVAEAANFFQLDGFLHGRSEIRAEDPERTHILGNYQFRYRERHITCDSPYPWYNRVFMHAHTEIECDPDVWDKVEALIRAKLPPAEPGTSSAQAATEKTEARQP